MPLLGRTPRLGESLFDGKQTGSLEANARYMARAHSFFVPYLAQLVDSEGLFAYLQEKVCRYHTCIYCNRPFGSLEACRKHMRDKSHCKVNLDDERGVIEICEFYDFGLGEEGDGGPRRVEGSGELVLPNGTRLGHRAMHRFYKQKFRDDGASLSVAEGRFGVRRPVSSYAHRPPPKSVLAKLALREEARRRHGMLVKSFALAKGSSKAIASLFSFKADFAYNKHAHAITHHWGAGGGGAHYTLSGSRAFHKGNKVKGLIQRKAGKTKGVQATARVQAARNRANRASASTSVLR